jgi:hypothetical protein
MSNLKDVFESNREKILELAEKNTKRNEDGLTIIEKNDPWRD